MFSIISVILLTTNTPKSIFTYSTSCVWLKHLELVPSGVILLHRWSCEWFCPATKSQTLKYTLAKWFPLWAKPVQKWRKREKAYFRTFLNVAVLHRFFLKKFLQLSIRDSQQQMLEAEQGLRVGFHSCAGPDPQNNEAKWVKAKDMLTEASWTVPSSVPEALSVHNVFNSVILGPGPALMLRGWLSPPLP